MKAIRSCISLPDYQKSIASALQDPESLVFVDTSVIAWSFRLNNEALRDLSRWLRALGGRLVIPAWVVHEYNHHLLRDDAGFFLPHKDIAAKMDAGLADVDAIAHMMVDDQVAEKAGYKNRDEMLGALGEAKAVVRKCAEQLAKQNKIRKTNLIEFWEHTVDTSGLDSDIQRLATAADDDAACRASHRLSPGYKDAGKATNAAGDLIVWKEIMACCVSRGVKNAILATNDMKSDWLYSPRQVELPNGDSVPGDNPLARGVRLPKPDLVAEFARETGGGTINVLSTRVIADVLSSDALNPRDAADFRQLAIAVRLDLARTPTETVIQWFLTNHDLYQEALKGVCHWRESPSEVNQAAFQAWTVAKLEAEKLKVDLARVQWSNVFCELFL